MDMKNNNLMSIKDVPESNWKQLSMRKIYFGHQSVGSNILDGIQGLMRENGQIHLDIIETTNPMDVDGPRFIHSRIGKNMDPLSKIAAFRQLMDSGYGERLNVAFFKLCYIDVGSATDVKDLFRVYSETMRGMKDKYANVQFIHVTVPLRIVQTGIRVPIKRILGRPIGGYEDNIKRNEFNELLMQAYQGKELVFDLAGIESTFSDGSRASFAANGRLYSSLVPAYTNDGGHLNESGRRVVAEKLLVFLANLQE